MLFDFAKADLKQWKAFDDRPYGGISEAHIGLTTEGETTASEVGEVTMNLRDNLTNLLGNSPCVAGGETFLRFEGKLSTEISDGAPALARSGIAGFTWVAEVCAMRLADERCVMETSTERFRSRKFHS